VALGTQHIVRSRLHGNRTSLKQHKHTHGVLFTRLMAPSDGRTTPDSLFSEDGDDEPIALPVAPVGLRSTPPIPGLWAFPDLLPLDVASEYYGSRRRWASLGIAHSTLEAIAEEDLFSGGRRDQVMLFSRAGGSGLPSFLEGIIDETERLLSDRLPGETMTTLFSQPLARQVILNMYPPGEGISPHIDLPDRYADVIVGVSLTGGCVMVFAKGRAVHHMYLPPRTVYVLMGPARWEWSHGIAPRREDAVEDEDENEDEDEEEDEVGSRVRVRTRTILRDLRVSVTFRWMKPGADVLS
jgi:hypothetical protein